MRSFCSICRILPYSRGWSYFHYWILDPGISVMNVEGEVWDPIQGSISPCGAFGMCLKKSESKWSKIFCLLLLPLWRDMERHGETWRDVERRGETKTSESIASWFLKGYLVPPMMGPTIVSSSRTAPIRSQVEVGSDHGNAVPAWMVRNQPTSAWSKVRGVPLVLTCPKHHPNEVVSIHWLLGVLLQ